MTVFPEAKFCNPEFRGSPKTSMLKGGIPFIDSENLTSNLRHSETVQYRMYVWFCIGYLHEVAYGLTTGTESAPWM